VCRGTPKFRAIELSLYNGANAGAPPKHPEECPTKIVEIAVEVCFCVPIDGPSHSSRPDNGSRASSWPAATTRLFQNAHPVVLGILWGFSPCGMVYAALLNAMLSGSFAAGAGFMAGFGLATIPAVATAAFGVTALAGFGSRLPRSKLRGALGTAILALGLASLVEPAASLSALCLGR
jgi:hypothetical protein